MRSETHCTPCLSISSATLNASRSGVFLSIIERILSFGMVIRVSTFSLSRSYPSNATPLLLCPSNANGFVTTPTTSAPRDFAISAIIGAAPVPVPPQRPQVINTISAPVRICLISSLDSSAAFFPISGFAQAQSPRVVALPILIRVGAFDEKRA
jgi:hypothetical protein